jgi:hypothetical protein
MFFKLFKFTVDFLLFEAKSTLLELCAVSILCPVFYLNGTPPSPHYRPLWPHALTPLSQGAIATLTIAVLPPLSF